MTNKDVSVRLLANTTQYKAAMADAGRSTQMFASGTSKASAGAVGGLKSMAGAAGLGSLALGAAAVKATKMSLDFDTAFAKIEGLVGTTGAELESMREHVLNLAGETAKAPQELADAMYFIASSGLAGQEALDALEMSAKASAAGLGDTAVVADAVTSAMNAYAAEGLTAADATDILTAAVAQGKGEPEELAGSLGKVIPIAAEMGVEFHEVAGALAAMSLAGIDADEGTTALRGMLTGLLSPAAETVDVLDDLGLSVEDVQDSLANQGLMATLRDLQGRLEGNNMGMEDLFPNVRALAGVMNLLGGEAEHVDAVLQNVEQSTGATNAAFEVMADTTQFKVTAAWSQMSSDVIKFVGDVAAFIEAHPWNPEGSLLEGGGVGDLYDYSVDMFNVDETTAALDAAGKSYEDVTGKVAQAVDVMKAYQTVQDQIDEAVNKRRRATEAAERAAAREIELAAAYRESWDAEKDYFRGVQELNAEYDDFGLGLQRAKEANQQFFESLGANDARFDDLAGSIGKATREVRDFTAEFKELQGELAGEDVWSDIQESFDEYLRLLEDAGPASEMTARQQAASARAVDDEIRKLKASVLEYGHELGNLPDQVTSEIIALLDDGAVMRAEAILERIARQREALIVVRTVNSKGQGIAGAINSLGSVMPSGVNAGNSFTSVRGAEGALVTKPTGALIGEAGPELVIPLHKMPGASAVPDMSGMGGGYSSTVAVSVDARGAIGVDGPAIERFLVEKLRRHVRFNGPLTELVRT
jgi:TP901 family phage tail tape measure protein